MYDEYPPSAYGLRTPHYGAPDWRYFRELGEIPADDDGPFWLGELLKFSDRVGERTGRAVYEEGDIDEVVELHGGVKVVCGDVLGAGEHNEDEAPHLFKMTRYPSRRAFFDQTCSREFVTHHRSHELALERALVLACVPTPVMKRPSDLALPRWSETPHPATDHDSPVLTVNLIRYHPNSAVDVDAHGSYARMLNDASFPEGGRITRSFAVEAVAVSNGIEWHEVRITAYPSHAAATATAERLRDNLDFAPLHSALVEHQIRVVVKPSIDQLARSIHH